MSAKCIKRYEPIPLQSVTSTADNYLFMLLVIPSNGNPWDNDMYELRIMTAKQIIKLFKQAFSYKKWSKDHDCEDGRPDVNEFLEYIDYNKNDFEEYFVEGKGLKDDDRFLLFNVPQL